jgi:hypothetical protein
LSQEIWIRVAAASSRRSITGWKPVPLQTIIGQPVSD